MSVNADDPGSPPLTRREENARATRQALIDAARELFTVKGYADTGTEEIVARARVTRGALYHHFDSKEGLFRAVVEQLINGVVQSLMARGMAGELAGGDDLWELFRAGFRTYLDLCLDPSFQRLVILEGPAVIGADITRAEQSAVILERGWLERAMAEGVVVRAPVDALTALLQGLVGAAGRYVAESGDKDAARRDVGEALDTVLRGLAADAATATGQAPRKATSPARRPRPR